MAWDTEAAAASLVLAKEEFNAHIEDWSAADLAVWLKKWINGPDGNHSVSYKALGRLITQLARDVEAG